MVDVKLLADALYEQGLVERELAPAIAEAAIQFMASRPNTPTEDVVERVGRALYEDWVKEDFNNEYCAWDQLLGKEPWLRRARAAIEAVGG